MKIACLIMCHKDAAQVNRLIDRLQHKDLDFFVHPDLKMTDAVEICEGANVWILPQNQRTAAQWGQYSLVQASLNLLRAAAARDEYDYFVLLSGQDYPIWPVDELVQYLESNRGSNYMNLTQSQNWLYGRTNNYDKRNHIKYWDWMIGRKSWQRVVKNAYIALTGGYDHTFACFERRDALEMKYYFGSEWWCLDNASIGWMLGYIKNHPDYEAFFRKTLCPDESFFQTLFMNSPYRASRKEHLHYIDWSEGKSSPKTLITEDYEAIKNSRKFFARKVSVPDSVALMETLDKTVQRPTEEKEH